MVAGLPVAAPAAPGLEVLDHRRRLAPANDAPAAQFRGPVRAGGELFLMGDEQHRAAPLQCLDDAGDLVLGEEVDARRGLVQDRHRGCRARIPANSMRLRSPPERVLSRGRAR